METWTKTRGALVVEILTHTHGSPYEVANSRTRNTQAADLNLVQWSDGL